MTLEQASTGFRNQGQFVAALNVSRNRGIAFADLKTAMTVEGLSLGQAVRRLRGTTPPNVKPRPNVSPGTNPNTQPGTGPNILPGTNPNTPPGTGPNILPGTNPNTQPGTGPNLPPGGTDPNTQPGIDPN
jgi:hypothetical protein